MDIECPSMVQKFCRVQVTHSSSFVSSMCSCVFARGLYQLVDPLRIFPFCSMILSVSQFSSPAFMLLYDPTTSPLGCLECFNFVTFFYCSLLKGRIVTITVNA